MRLIDADELLKQIKYKPVPNILNETWNELYERVIDEIDNAPTVAEVFKSGSATGIRLIERPHGEWLHHNSYYKRCSLCQKIVGFDYILQDGEAFNYCPNCGADMRKGGAE